MTILEFLVLLVVSFGLAALAFFSRGTMGVCQSFLRSTLTIGRVRTHAQIWSYVATTTAIMGLLGAMAGWVSVGGSLWARGAAAVLLVGLAMVYATGREGGLERPVGMKLSRFGFGTLGGVLGSAGFGVNFALTIPGTVMPFAGAALVQAMAHAPSALWGMVLLGGFGLMFSGGVAVAVLARPSRQEMTNLAMRSQRVTRLVPFGFAAIAALSVGMMVR